MNTQPVGHPLLELGTFSIVVPGVWLIAAAAGSILLFNWPELFADPARKHSGALSGTTAAPATSLATQEPLLPQTAP